MIRMTIKLLVLSTVISLFAGCAFTRMETANQLEAEELVYSGSLDNIGFGPIPRANFTVMSGVGGAGDVSAHVGTTIFTANAGLGARYYLGERLNLSLQGDVMTVLLGLPFSPHDPFVIASLSRRSCD